MPKIGMTMKLPDAVVFVCDGTHLGGAELYSLRILRQLNAWGVKLYLITNAKGLLLPDYEKVVEDALFVPFPYPRKPVSWVNSLKFKNLSTSFIGQIPKNKAFLVGDFYPLWATLLLKKKTASPVISFWQSEYQFNDSSCFKKWMRYGAERADKLVASEPVAAHANALRLGNKSVTPLNPNVDTTRFDFQKYEKGTCRQAIHLKKYEKIAICIGQVGEGKGQPWLVNAFVNNPKLYQTWKLIIVGPVRDQDGTLWRNLLKRDTAKRVLMLGSREDVPELLAASDLAIFPGKASESFGLAVVEACLMQVPVLAFDSGAIAYTLGKKYSGLIPNSQSSRLIAQWEKLTPKGLEELQAALPHQAIVKKVNPKQWAQSLKAIVSLG